MAQLRLVALALLLAGAAATPVAAQDFGRILGNTVERAVESEVRSRVDREARRVTRCVLGDNRCIRAARERGDDIEIDRSGAAAPTDAVQSTMSPLATELARTGRVTLDGVHFEAGEDTLRAESDAALAEVGLLLRDDPNLRLMIESHTDSTGSRAASQTLSQRRAERLREAIIVRYGVAPERLGAAGYGSDRAIADNGTEQGRAQNRRVELVRQ